MKSITKRRGTEQSGFALIVTIILLSLLAVMAVAFLSSSQVERGSSKAVADKVKADLAAQAAVNTAAARLVDNLTSFPDSATSWEKVLQPNGTDLQYQGTTLYYREQTPEATAAATPSPLHMLPLISGAEPVVIWPQTTGTVDDAKRSSLPVLDNTNSYDLNRARFSGDLQGVIGSPAGAATRPEFRGQWVNVTDSEGKVTARYAYWVEDESFKSNVNLLGNSLRGSTSLGQSPSEVPLQGLFKSIGSNADANAVFSYRSRFPGSKFFEYGALNQSGGPSTLAESAKFEATVFSGATNLSRSGGRRINLNKIITSTTDATAIRTQLDQIINPITTQLPNFGQRFYRQTANSNFNSKTDVTATHATIYLNKLAANIRDYIDTDSQPTIINNDPPTYSVKTGGLSPNDGALAAQGGGNSGPNEVIAIGKERIPYLDEYALRIRLIKFSPAGFYPDKTKTDLGNPGAQYEFYLDYYFEFWNLTNKDISVSDLGPNPYIKVMNQPKWDTAGGTRTTQSYITPGTDIPSDPKRDFKIPLTSIPGLVFKAGQPTVITTDQNSFSTLVPNSALVFTATTLVSAQGTGGGSTDDFRRYAGTTFKYATSAHPVGFTSSSYGLRLSLLTRSTSSSDYETELVLANDNGYLDSFEGLNISTAIAIDNDSGNAIDSQAYFIRGGYLRGNYAATQVTPGSHTGDPRTTNEQLTIAVSDSSFRGGPNALD